MPTDDAAPLPETPAPTDDAEEAPATKPLLQPEDSGDAGISYEGFDVATLPGEFDEAADEEAETNAVEEASPASS